MRVLIFHGYLLRGTGSNVYNASLAAALGRLGHEVHLVCQDRDPEAAGLPRGGPVTVHNPDIGRLLPVYVADHYDGFDAKPLLECTDEEIDRYVAANVTAVREIAESVAPDAALANHLVMGPAILARALGDAVPYAVKIHGSALEYVVKRDPARFIPWAREGLERARSVLVGSLHVASSLWEAMGDDALPARTRLGPPGVDEELFVARPRDEAAPRVAAIARDLLDRAGPSGVGSFARDDRRAGAALAALAASDEPLVLYVGKLIVSKGVDLLAAAWPLVLERRPDARLVVVGFGAYREAFEELIDALTAGDLDRVSALAEAGREAEGGPRGRLAMLSAFVASLTGDRRDDYLAAAARMAQQTTVVGRLDHAELGELTALCAAQIVPSTFPEAYGMVAAEAAACGVLPISAAHSGLADVTRSIAGAVPEAARPLLSFELGPGAVDRLADRIVAWLEAPEELRQDTRRALAAIAHERFSWEQAAIGVLAGAQGRLEDLVRPA